MKQTMMKSIDISLDVSEDERIGEESYEKKLNKRKFQFLEFR